MEWGGEALGPATDLVPYQRAQLTGYSEKSAEYGILLTQGFQYPDYLDQ